MKYLLLIAVTGSTNRFKKYKVERSEATAAPKRSEATTMRFPFLSFIVFVITKNKRIAKSKGIDWNKESNLFFEIMEDTRTIAPKAKTGASKGLAFKTTFFSAIDFTAQRARRRRVAPTIKYCFGIMKKSVELVRKITGRKKTVSEIITVEEISI